MAGEQQGGPARIAERKCSDWERAKTVCRATKIEFEAPNTYVKIKYSQAIGFYAAIIKLMPCESTLRHN